VNQCADLLEDTIENESGPTPLIDRVRTRINKIFEIKNNEPEEIMLNEFIKHRLENLTPKFHHRVLEIVQNLDSTSTVSIAVEPLQKMIDGLIKNAVENTPDHGKIKVMVSKQESGSRLVVEDYGIGIIADHQQRIFEGFFTTQETSGYSSKKLFDFNAGGRGADLLRMKIFSEQYNFSIDVTSNRCKFIPGNIDECTFCSDKKDCYQSGGSVFSVNFKCKSH